LTVRDDLIRFLPRKHLSGIRTSLNCANIVMALAFLN